MGSRAYEEQEGHNKVEKAAMLRKGYIECEQCGEVFMPRSEEDINCEDCIDRKIED